MQLIPDFYFFSNCYSYLIFLRGRNCGGMDEEEIWDHFNMLEEGQSTSIYFFKNVNDFSPFEVP